MDPYDVIIIGAGVTGTATFYVLANYSSVQRMALLERYDIAQLNSNKDNNSQTLHFGDIETNYTGQKSKTVQQRTELTRLYLEKHKEEGIFRITSKMVLGMGAEEVRILEERYEEIKNLYPKLRKIGRIEIEAIEPNVVKGRNPNEEIIALYSPDGYTVNYGALAKSFAKHAQVLGKKIEVRTQTKVQHIIREGDLYRIITNDKEEFVAKTVVVAGGADSLLFAHSLNYARHWILLPVAGSFYSSPHLLSGKVYTVQAKKLPFAAVHGDPDVSNPHETRFGPTAKVLPMTQRYRYRSILDFLRLFRFRYDATMSLIHIIRDPVLFHYIARNVLYDLPFIGTYFFMKWNVRKIVPSITYSQIRYGRGLGGIRPQLVDTKKRALEFGDAKIIGDGIIFDITPSPGASVALHNGLENARKVAEFIGAQFDEKKFQKEYGKIFK